MSLTDMTITEMSLTDMSITEMSITDMSITDMSITDMSITDTQLPHISFWKLACLPIIPVESYHLGSFCIFFTFFTYFLNNNNKYLFLKFIFTKFVFSILLYLSLLLEVNVYLNYKCGFYSLITLVQSGQTNTQTNTRYILRVYNATASDRELDFWQGGLRWSSDINILIRKPYLIKVGIPCYATNMLYSRVC